jgi:hypothetical protein
MTNAILQHTASYVQFLRPLRNRLSSSFKCYRVIVAFVIRLFCPRCPSYIVRPIPLVVVFSVKRVFFAWSRANVSQEGSEVVPTGIVVNAAPTIVFPVFNFRIRAASLYGSPDTVLISCLSSTCCSVSNMGCNNFSVKTPTRSRQTSYQISCKSNDEISTSRS